MTRGARAGPGAVSQVSASTGTSKKHMHFTQSAVTTGR